MLDRLGLSTDEPGAPVRPAERSSGRLGGAGRWWPDLGRVPSANAAGPVGCETTWSVSWQAVASLL